MGKRGAKHVAIRFSRLAKPLLPLLSFYPPTAPSELSPWSLQQTKATRHCRNLSSDTHTSKSTFSTLAVTVWTRRESAA
jgi:hypothetical protein